MVEIEMENGGNIAISENLATVAFLGALCCTVIGIGIKWFRAQLSFANDEIEAPSVQPKLGVYRSYGIEVYNPSYRVYDESPSTSRLPAVKTKDSDVLTSNNVGTGVENREPEYVEIDTVNGHNHNESPNSNQKNHKVKKSKKKAVRHKTKEEKEQEAQLKKNKEEREKQQKLEQKLQEKQEKEEKLRMEKEQKEEKARMEKENKAKIEREKREKKEREKELKKKKPKEKIIASSDDMPNDIVQAQNTPSRAVETSTSSSRAAQVQNPLGTPDNNYEPVGDFTSSWDMVAAHRKDLRRDVQPNNPNVRRGVVSSQINGTGTAINTLYMPTQIESRNPMAALQEGSILGRSRISDTSEIDSDTEA